MAGSIWPEGFIPYLSWKKSPVCAGVTCSTEAFKGVYFVKDDKLFCIPCWQKKLKKKKEHQLYFSEWRRYWKGRPSISSLPGKTAFGWKEGRHL